MNKHQINQICSILSQHYTDKCGLDFSSAFEMLVATMLSAQCTDVRVNEVTKVLFSYANNPTDMLALSCDKLKELIKSCGLSNNKAKNILATSEILINEYDSIVPNDMQKLIALPGVGRKTANVVLSNVFGVPAIAVDTHVFRVSNKIGLAKAKNVLDTEKQLMKNLKKQDWSAMHHRLIWHGRKICTARNPKCEICPINDYCQDYTKNRL